VQLASIQTENDLHPSTVSDKNITSPSASTQLVINISSDTDLIELAGRQGVDIVYQPYLCNRPLGATFDLDVAHLHPVYNFGYPVTPALRDSSQYGEVLERGGETSSLIYQMFLEVRRVESQGIDTSNKLIVRAPYDLEKNPEDMCFVIFGTGKSIFGRRHAFGISHAVKIPKEIIALSLLKSPSN
jgi:hypothetical protein